MIGNKLIHYFFHLISFTLLFISNSVAQDITAFTDNRGNLQVFDKGQYREIEYLPVKSYKIGGNCIAYIDNKNDFKIYYNGQTFQLLNAADFSYFMTDYLTAFKVGDVLYAFDKGEKRTLCFYTSIMTVNDSVLAYFDESASSLFIYYDGKVINAEESLISTPKAIKTGSNLVAWVNQSGLFIAFYNGRTYNLDNIAPITFEAGRDVMAYIDDYEQHFHLFYKGDTATIEEFLPDSFKVGNGTVAYVDNLGNFRVFYNGVTRRILTNRPDFFKVKGNVVIYSYNNSFNIIYNGETYYLQNMTPKNFQLGNNGIAWIDDSGRLEFFNKGKTYTASYEIINDYFLNGDVLKFSIGVSATGIFYNGRNY